MKNIIFFVTVVILVNDVQLNAQSNFNTKIIINKCDSLINKGKQQEALELLTYEINMGNKFSELYFERAKCYFNYEKNYIKCDIECDSALKLNPKFAPAYVWKGLVEYNTNSYKEAIKYYDEAIKIDTNYAKAYKEKAHTIKQLGDYKESIKIYNKILDTLTVITYEDKVFSYNGRANCYYYLGDNKSAIDNFNRSIKFDSLNTNKYYAYLKLGMIYYEGKNYIEADKFLNLSISLLEKLKETKFDLLAEAYIFKYKISKDSVLLTKAEDLSKLAKKQNNLTYALYISGLVKYEKGDLEGAISELDDAIKIRKQDARFLVTRANSYYRLAIKQIAQDEKCHLLNNAIKDYQKIEHLDQYQKDEIFYDYTLIELEKCKQNNPTFISKEDKFENRKNYAILFACERYDNNKSWANLNNPIKDAEAFARQLVKFGFDTMIIRNPTKNEFREKLRDATKRNFGIYDQLLVFYTGHGHYDSSYSKEGYLVFKDSKGSSIDTYNESYIPYAEIKNVTDNSDCKHVMLILDACHSGTFADEVAYKGEESKEKTIDLNTISTTLKEFRTRKYITSVGNTLSLDGYAGNNSPFMESILYSLIQCRKLMSFEKFSDDISTTISSPNFQSKITGNDLPRKGGFKSDASQSSFYFIRIAE